MKTRTQTRGPPTIDFIPLLSQSTVLFEYTCFDVVTYPLVYALRKLQVITFCFEQFVEVLGLSGLRRSHRERAGSKSLRSIYP